MKFSTIKIINANFSALVRNNFKFCIINIVQLSTLILERSNIQQPSEYLLNTCFCKMKVMQQSSK